MTALGKEILALGVLFSIQHREQEVQIDAYAIAGFDE